MARIFDLMDQFEAASTDEDRDRIRDEIQRAGFLGVAATIGAEDADDIEQLRIVRRAVARGDWRG